MNKIDSRGWVSIGLFALTLIVVALLALNPSLQDNKLFATLAQAIVITGLINLAASFYFGASKSGEAISAPPVAPAAAPAPVAPSKAPAAKP